MTKWRRAPLPFQGQKRQFYNHFIDALKYFPDDAVYIDVFGGSGLLSRWTKDAKPNATVIYNDYDNYAWRLQNIENTLSLCTRIKQFCDEQGIVQYGKISGEAREAVKSIIESVPHEELDYKTLGSWIRFSGNFYAGNTIEGLLNTPLYNRFPRTYYPVEGYLEGLEIVSMSYEKLLEEYKNKDNVVLILDPPYIFTDRKTYSGYFSLISFLRLMHMIENSNFIYFSSERSEFSSYIEYCREINLVNSIARAKCTGSIISSINKGGRYVDYIYISQKGV